MSLAELAQGAFPFVCGAGGVFTTIGGVMIAAIGLMRARAASHAKVEIAQEQGAAQVMPLLTARLAAQDAKIDAQTARLDEQGERLNDCEDKHKRCEERASTAVARAEELSGHLAVADESIAQLQAMIKRELYADNTGRFELERARSTPAARRTIPPPRRRPTGDGEDIE